jgi:hypothetical protein
MNFCTAMEKCGIDLAVTALCFSLVVIPVSAGHKNYHYYDGEGAFKQEMRDYGRRVGQGARNYYDRGKRVYDRYGRPLKEGFGSASRALKYRSPVPIIIVPENYRRPSGQMY